MTHTETVRTKVLRLVNKRPFSPFVLQLENGERVSVEHPENIAFNPGSVKRPEGSSSFSVVGDDDIITASFVKVTAVVEPDRGELAG